jgi:hypothetical protein
MHQPDYGMNHQRTQDPNKQNSNRRGGIYRLGTTWDLQKLRYTGANDDRYQSVEYRALERAIGQLVT